MTSWAALASDELEFSGRQIIDQIAANISTLAKSTDSASFLAEAALLYAYLYRAESCEIYAERTEDLLNLAIDCISANYGARRLGLHGGVAETGWIIEHLRQLVGLDDQACGEKGPDSRDMGASEDDPVVEVDEFLIRSLRNSGTARDYDLISGLVGLGVYFLQRIPRKSALRGIRLVLEHLETEAQQTPQGISWHTAPEFLPPLHLEACPNGYYNLGVAHGIPGVLYVLAEALALNVHLDTTKTVLDGAARWLLAQQRPPRALSRYSSWVVPGYDSGDSRLGWCYGDLGIAAILCHVGARASIPEMEHHGTALLMRCVSWPLEHARIRDAGLCHGAVGVAHIFNRAYQATKQEEFRGAAIAWLQRAVEMRRTGEGVGGFLSYKPESTPPWDPDPSLLSGGIGIALGFLSALYPIEPMWDRLLLLSKSNDRGLTAPSWE